MIFGCLFSHSQNFASPGGHTCFSFVRPRHDFESLRSNILHLGKPCFPYIWDFSFDGGKLE